MKIKLLKKNNSFKKKDFVFNTNLYWKGALFFAFIFILSSFIFGYLLFAQTNRGPDLSAVNQDAQILMIKKDRIQKVLDYFYEKEQKSAEILISPVSVVDPSL